MFKRGTLWRSPAPRGVVLAMLALGGAACATTGAVPQPFPKPGGTVAGPANRPAGTSGVGEPAPARSGAADGYAIAGTALGLRGTPYRSGGSDPSGFDCSGLVWYVFSQHGIRVARTVAEQYRDGSDVPGAVEPGDLLFFSTDSRGASHVGMAIGGDEFVHAPTSRGEVRVERLSAPYWSSRYIGARRVR